MAERTHLEEFDSDSESADVEFIHAIEPEEVQVKQEDPLELTSDHVTSGISALEEKIKIEILETNTKDESPVDQENTIFAKEPGDESMIQRIKEEEDPLKTTDDFKIVFECKEEGGESFTNTRRQIILDEKNSSENLEYCAAEKQDNNQREVTISYKCDECHFLGRDSVSLTMHKESKHERIRFKCDQCDYTSNHTEFLKHHKDRSHGAGGLPCDQCAYVSPGFSDLKKHKRKYHEHIDPSDLCDNENTSSKKMVMRRVCLQKRKFTCDQCDFVAETQVDLTRHQKRGHKPGNGRFQCDQCDFWSKHAEALKHHKESIHMSVRYQCDQCEYTSAHEELLKPHKEKMHKVIQYKCDRCDYASVDKDSLKQHRQDIHKVVIFEKRY